MQPFPSLPSLRSSAAWIALFGFTLAGASLSIEPIRTTLLAFQGHSNIASSDDDRGSGRVADQAESQWLVSFRGSGRMQPEPKPPSFSNLPDSAPYYRGSGRLG